MDFGVSNILLEESKSKNKTALNGIVRAKASLIRMKISGILNSNVRSQYDVIDNVLDEANKGISSLKKDRETLEYLSRVSSEYEFDDNFLELIRVIGTRDEELFFRFCKVFESTMYIKRGLRFEPQVPEDVTEDRDKVIDDKMRLIRELNTKA